MAAPARPAVPAQETISQETARVFCEALDQRPYFHTLSLIAGVAAIPLLNQIGLDGSWVAAAGQAVLKGAQNHFLARAVTSGVAGYTVLAALQIWAKTLESPTADSAKYKANVAIFEELTNAMNIYDMRPADYSKLPLLIRFHQIMRAFDTKLFDKPAEAPVVENPSASFSAPFKSTSSVGKPGLEHRYLRALSNLSKESVLLHALSITCGSICYKIIPMLKLDGAWSKAFIEKVQKVPGLTTFTGETLTNAVKKTASKWKVAQRVGKIAAGYLAVVAVKGLLSRMKAPSANKAAQTKVIKTLAQLSYAMHVVETRKERNKLAEKFTGETLMSKILALPCSEAPLLDRFNKITSEYSKALAKKSAESASASAPEPAPVVPVATDVGFANDTELQTCVVEWQTKPTQAAKEAFLNSFSPKKQNLMMKFYFNLQMAEMERRAAEGRPGGTGGTAAP